jgi:uncharacterized protein
MPRVRAVIDDTADGRNACDVLYELGVRHCVGRSQPVDLVSAHKWFNLAAMRGSKEAARMRLEIAAEMSTSEIAAAQRAARDWLTKH